MYLGIVETESGSYSACHLGMRHPDSSVGSFAITSLGALRRTLVDSSPCANAAASLLYW